MMHNASNIFTLLQNATQLLTVHNIKEAKLDAEILLCAVLKIKRSKLFTIRTSLLTDSQVEQYQKYIARRINREPVAYITKETEFMGLKFNVNPDVLIPRQETELLVEKANSIISKNKLTSVLDLCTGSGCIAVSIAYYNDVSVTAVDISKPALDTALSNSVKNNVAEKIHFLKSNMFDNINKEKFDIIISNPPYVTEDEFKVLEQELFFEPKNALVAKDCGLFFYKEIAKKCKKYLNDKGIILLELNANISHQTAEIFKQFKFIKIIKDYSNLDRILVLQNG